MSGSRKAVTADQPAVVLDGYEIRTAVQQAVTEHMRATYPGLPRLFWDLEGALPLALSGHASVLAGCLDPADAIKRWADALGLVPVAAPLPGTIEWVGQLPTNRTSMIDVRLWAIVDQAAWESKGGHR